MGHRRRHAYVGALPDDRSLRPSEQPAGARGTAVRRFAPGSLSRFVVSGSPFAHRRGPTALAALLLAALLAGALPMPAAGVAATTAGALPTPVIVAEPAD